jgi:hypothetical protein
MTLHFHTGQLDEAITLVKRHHYSRRAPANVQVVGTLHDEGGLFGDHGEAVAACFFCFPAAQWKEPVLELTRLVRTDLRIPLTPLISMTAKVCKARGWDLLISYADKEQGHHGGIYQAASWDYDGARERQLMGCIVNGEKIHGRTCNHLWGTRSPEKLRQIVKGDVQPHYDEGKHLYWRALGSRGKAKAARLGLKALPYPKPGLKVAAE